jgi:CBS domain-containing protein
MSENGERNTPSAKTDQSHGARMESVRNLQLRDFICVAPTTSIVESVARMEREETDGIFVCHDGHVAGVLTLCDLMAQSGQANLNPDAHVRDFMRTEVQTVSSEKTLGDVVRLMNKSGHTHVAVTEGSDNDCYIGAVSDLDIITYLAESYPKETINLPPVTTQVMDTREGG